LSSDKLTDNNDDKGYFIGMKKANGSPVEGEQLVEGLLCQGTGGLIGMKSNLKDAQLHYDNEIAAYPASFNVAPNTYYAILMSNKDVTKAAATKQRILTAFKNTSAPESELSIMAAAFASSEKPLYDSLSKVILARYPKGTAAAVAAMAPFRKETDPVKKAELYTAIKNNYTLTKAQNDNMLMDMANAYAAKKDLTALKNVWL